MTRILDNEDFIKILKSCCKDGVINDEKLDFILSHYSPYNLTFKNLRRYD